MKSYIDIVAREHKNFKSCLIDKKELLVKRHYGLRAPTSIKPSYYFSRTNGYKYNLNAD